MSIYADVLGRRARGAIRLMIGVVFGVLWGGCDTAVPIFENPEDHPLYFSLYGQVAYPEGGMIRVEPLRDSIAIGAPEEAPETVTFTTVATGAVDTLELASRRAGQLPVHNYRTPSSLTAGARYRIEVSSPEGNATSATVKLPVRRPEVQVLDTLRYCDLEEGSGEIRIRAGAIENLGRISIRYRTRFGLSDPYLWTNESQQVDEGVHQVRIDTDQDLRHVAAQGMGIGPSFVPPPPAVAEAATVTVVSAGPSWPGDGFNLTRLEEIAVPNQYSNVRQGLGLVVGTYPVEVNVPIERPPGFTQYPCPDR